MAGVAAAAGLWHGGYVHYALALSGDPARQYEYGRWLEDHNKSQDALMWISIAADRYEPRALVWMGMTANWQSKYFTYPVSEDAFYYLKEAANRKQVVGMILLASMYERSQYLHRKLTKKDAQKAALVWYTTAAREGAGIAIDRLVQIYENGELGETKSREEANKWQSYPRKADAYWQNIMNY